MGLYQKFTKWNLNHFIKRYNVEAGFEEGSDGFISGANDISKNTEKITEFYTSSAAMEKNKRKSNLGFFNPFYNYVGMNFQKQMEFAKGLKELDEAYTNKNPNPDEHSNSLTIEEVGDIIGHHRSKAATAALKQYAADSGMLDYNVLQIPQQAAPTQDISNDETRDMGSGLHVVGEGKEPDSYDLSKITVSDIKETGEKKRFGISWYSTPVAEGAGAEEKKSAKLRTFVKNFGTVSTEISSAAIDLGALATGFAAYGHLKAYFASASAVDNYTSGAVKGAAYAGLGGFFGAGIATRLLLQKGVRYLKGKAEDNRTAALRTSDTGEKQKFLLHSDYLETAAAALSVLPLCKSVLSFSHDKAWDSVTEHHNTETHLGPKTVDFLKTHDPSGKDFVPSAESIYASARNGPLVTIPDNGAGHSHVFGADSSGASDSGVVSGTVDAADTTVGDTAIGNTGNVPDVTHPAVDNAVDTGVPDSHTAQAEAADVSASLDTTIESAVSDMESVPSVLGHEWKSSDIAHLNMGSVNLNDGISHPLDVSIAKDGGLDVALHGAMLTKIADYVAVSVDYDNDGKADGTFFAEISGGKAHLDATNYDLNETHFFVHAVDAQDGLELDSDCNLVGNMLDLANYESHYEPHPHVSPAHAAVSVQPEHHAVPVESHAPAVKPEHHAVPVESHAPAVKPAAPVAESAHPAESKPTYGLAPCDALSGKSFDADDVHYNMHWEQRHGAEGNFTYDNADNWFGLRSIDANDENGLDIQLNKTLVENANHAVVVVDYNNDGINDTWHFLDINKDGSAKLTGTAYDFHDPNLSYKVGAVSADCNPDGDLWFLSSWKSEWGQLDRGASGDAHGHSHPHMPSTHLPDTPAHVPPVYATETPDTPIEPTGPEQLYVFSMDENSDLGVLEDRFGIDVGTLHFLEESEQLSRMANLGLAGHNFHTSDAVSYVSGDDSPVDLFSAQRNDGLTHVYFGHGDGFDVVIEVRDPSSDPHFTVDLDHGLQCAGHEKLDPSSLSLGGNDLLEFKSEIIDEFDLYSVDFVPDSLEKIVLNDQPVRDGFACDVITSHLKPHQHLIEGNRINEQIKFPHDVTDSNLYDMVGYEYDDEGFVVDMTNTFIASGKSLAPPFWTGFGIGALTGGTLGAILGHNLGDDVEIIKEAIPPGRTGGPGEPPGR